MYTNVDNLIYKRSKLLTIISADNPDIIWITETLLKHTHLFVNKCELQVHHYDCFSNATESKCHRGVVICMKKCLNVISFCIKQNILTEYS